MSYVIQPQMVYFRGTFEDIELLKNMTTGDIFDIQLYKWNRFEVIALLL